MENPYRDSFVKNDWDHLHDCWIHVKGSFPTRTRLEKMFDSLPEELQALAEEWGCNDTVVREEIIEWLVSNEFTED
jgi:hypothetical protein